MPFIGSYHQFDTVIYPPFLREAPKPSVIAQSVKMVKGWLGFSEQEHDGKAGDTDIPATFKLPSKDAMHEKCLQHYLSESLKVLGKGSLPQSSNVDQFVDNICHIYDCVSRPFLHDGDMDSVLWKWGNARDVSSNLIRIIQYLYG